MGLVFGGDLTVTPTIHHNRILVMAPSVWIMRQPIPSQQRTTGGVVMKDQPQTFLTVVTVLSETVDTDPWLILESSIVATAEVSSSRSILRDQAIIRLWRYTMGRVPQWI